MSNIKKFADFLESLKGNGQDALIESVKKGFRVCMESYELTPEDEEEWKNLGGDRYLRMKLDEATSESERDYWGERLTAWAMKYMLGL